EKPQIYLISPSGGEADALTSSKSGIGSFQWSPDGKRIAFAAQRDLTADEEKEQKDKDDAVVIDQQFRFTQLSTIDVATKKVTIVVNGAFQASDPQWSPDGSRIAYVTNPTPKADDGTVSDIFTVLSEGGTPKKLVENEGPDAAPRWSPDGTSIAYLTRPGKPTAVGLLQLSVASAGGTPKQLTAAKGVISNATFSRDRSSFAVTFQDLQHTADVHVAMLADASALTRVTDHNPQLRSFALGKSEIVHWKSKDGMDVEGILVYPVDYQPGKRYPMVAEIHGGPAGSWMENFPGSWGDPAHVWAGRGWAVFLPNPRGSSSYGEKFLRANIKDWGAGDYRDIQTGIDNMVAKGIADSTKLAQSGWSYGGYMTAWTLTQTNRFKAVMVGAGLTDMASM